MTATEPTLDLAAAHRFFAADCFKRAWDLTDQPERSPEENQDMLHLAIAALWHWTRREDCTPKNISIGAWQIARSYALLGQAENARRYAERALQAAESGAAGPFYIGYAYEALACAAAVGGDRVQAAAFVAEGRCLRRRSPPAGRPDPAGRFHAGPCWPIWTRSPPARNERRGYGGFLKKSLFVLPVLLALLMLLSSACELPALTGGSDPSGPAPTLPPAVPPGAPTLVAQPTSPGSSVEPGSEPAPPGAATPAAPPPAGGGLPAPLLFLAPVEETDQIWRLEVDGQGLRPLTQEAEPVLDFDVSAVDGRLAYVSGNDLIVANPDGGGRIVLVDGPETPPENDPQGALMLLGKPRWSPGGERIAYGLGGVNLVAASGGEPLRLLSSDPPPAAPDAPSQSPAYWYWPETWSPDGSRLLLGYSLWPDSGGLAILDAAGGAPRLIRSVEAFACCQPAWSADSAFIYYASPFFGMILSGMWVADAATGESRTLIQGDAPDGAFRLPGFVHPVAGGSLYYFYARSDAFPEGQIKLSPVHALRRRSGRQTPLRSDAWMVGEALWTPDGSGVVILDLETPAPPSPGGAVQPLGRLIYLASDNRPPLLLPAAGYTLRWGRP